jgi:hypothetical protein
MLDVAMWQHTERARASVRRVLAFRTPARPLRNGATEPTGSEHARPESSYEAPMGELEVELARVWQHVLRVERGGTARQLLSLGETRCSRSA